jgi:hypothetical protein
MITATSIGEVPQMVAVAIKKGQSREKARGLQERGTLGCDGCGEEFVVNHEPSIVNQRLAERQASWLERVLADDHQCDKKHPDRIELPN